MKFKYILFVFALLFNVAIIYAQDEGNLPIKKGTLLLGLQATSNYNLKSILSYEYIFSKKNTTHYSAFLGGNVSRYNHPDLFGDFYGGSMLVGLSTNFRIGKQDFIFGKIGSDIFFSACSYHPETFYPFLDLGYKRFMDEKTRLVFKIFVSINSDVDYQKVDIFPSLTVCNVLEKFRKTFFGGGVMIGYSF